MRVAAWHVVLPEQEEALLAFVDRERPDVLGLAWDGDDPLLLPLRALLELGFHTKVDARQATGLALIAVAPLRRTKRDAGARPHLSADLDGFALGVERTADAVVLHAGTARVEAQGSDPVMLETAGSVAARAPGVLPEGHDGGPPPSRPARGAEQR